MKNTTFTITLDDDTIGTLTLTYEASITRTKDRDHTGRTTWEPAFTHGLVSADLAAPNSSRSMTWTFSGTKEMDGRIKKAIQFFDGPIYHAIEDKVSSIVNDPNFEGDHDAEPND